MSDNKKTKKLRKIWLYILIALVLILAATAYWQRENIRVIVDIMNNTESELESRVVQSNEEIEKVLEIYGLEYSDIGEGTENPDETDAPTETDEPTQTDKPDGNGGKVDPPGSTKKETSGDIVKRYVSQMQSLRSGYVAQLETLREQAKGEFLALPKSKQNKASMASIASKHIGTAYSLQSSCDAQVDTLLANLEKELRAIGADTAIVATMKTAYQNEKSAKIAYYMGKIK